MDNKVLVTVRGNVYLYKMITAAKRTEASFKPFCLFKMSVATKSRKVKAFITSVPYIASARYVVCGFIYLTKVDFRLSKLRCVHSATDIHTYYIGYCLIGYRHCRTDSATLTCVYIGHYSDF